VDSESDEPVAFPYLMCGAGCYVSATNSQKCSAASTIHTLQLTGRLM